MSDDRDEDEVEDEINYVKCIADPSRPLNQWATLCGKDKDRWFVDVEHAQNNENKEGYLLVCPACAERAGIKVRAFT